MSGLAGQRVAVLAFYAGGWDEPVLAAAAVTGMELMRAAAGMREVP